MPVICVSRPSQEIKLHIQKPLLLTSVKTNVFESKFCLLEILVSQNLGLCLVLLLCRKLFILEHIY